MTILDNLIRRSLTAVFIVIFVLGGFWLHPYSFFLTGIVLLLGTQYEYYLLIRNTGVKPQMITGLIAGALIYIISTLAASGILGFKWLLLYLPVISVIMIIELYRRQERPFDSLAHTLFSLVYTAVPFSMFPFSAFSHTGLASILGHEGIVFSPGIVVGFFLMLWANDTGAYFVGVSLGRHRLMERISPKKTWEGFFGGLFISLAAAWLLGPFLGVVDRAGWMVISLIVSVSGTYGDLVESMLKRSLGVKDSGTIMPGHGGFLDRFDSAVISFPLVYLYIALFG